MEFKQNHQTLIIEKVLYLRSGGGKHVRLGIVYVLSELSVVDRESSHVLCRIVLLCIARPLPRKRLNRSRTIVTISDRIQVLAHALFEIHQGQECSGFFRWWPKNRCLQPVQLSG